MTTSFFTIDNNGYLVVNIENLDRDPPSPGTFRFQVVYHIVLEPSLLESPCDKRRVILPCSLLRGVGSCKLKD
jgi:hypothetical protein